MPRSPAVILPKSARDLLFLGSLSLAGWAWGVAVEAWCDIPGAAAAVLRGDHNVLHIEDLPPGGLALVSDVRMLGIDDELALELHPPRSSGPFQRVEEWIVSSVVATRLDPDTALVVWLNTVPVGTLDGSEVRGLDAGARTWFRKRVTELSTDEFATLVSMVGLDRARGPDVG
jgi:hypothetical protein